MRTRTMDPEEEYQVFCREYELDDKAFKIGFDARALCDHYFRLLLGFCYDRPLRERMETDCFTSLPGDLYRLSKYASRAGLKLSLRAHLGVWFLEKDFPVRRMPVRMRDLTESEAHLCKDTVEEVREKVLKLLPDDWRDEQELNTDPQIKSGEENANCEEAEEQIPILDYIRMNIGKLPDETLAGLVNARYWVHKTVAMDLCEHIRKLESNIE